MYIIRQSGVRKYTSLHCLWPRLRRQPLRRRRRRPGQTGSRLRPRRPRSPTTRPSSTDRSIDERKLTLITNCHNLWMRYHSHLSSSFFLYMGTWLHTSYTEVMASFNFLYGALLHSDMTSVKCTSDLGASSIHSVRGCPLPSVTITQHKLGSKVVWWVPWGSLKQ